MLPSTLTERTGTMLYHATDLYLLPELLARARTRVPRQVPSRPAREVTAAVRAANRQALTS